MKKTITTLALLSSVAFVSGCGGSATVEESKAAGAAAGAQIGKLMGGASSQQVMRANLVASKFARRVQTAETCEGFDIGGIEEEGITCTTAKCEMGETGIDIDISCKGDDTLEQTTTCGETTYTAKAPTFGMKLSASSSSQNFTYELSFGASIKGGTTLTDFTTLACTMNFDAEKMATLATKLGDSASTEDYSAAMAELVECELGGKSVDMKEAMTTYKDSCTATK